MDQDEDEFELDFDDIGKAEDRRREKTDSRPCTHRPACPFYVGKSASAYVCRLGDFHLLAAFRKLHVSRHEDDQIMARFLDREIRARNISLDMLPKRD